LAVLQSIDLRIADRLRDREFRRHWFRAMLETNVPEQVRDLREARSMTQSDLAVVADMKQSAISRFESQRVANWKLETLLKLADALDAQLEITIVPAEEVIARHEREEAGWEGSRPKSALEALPDQNRGPNDDRQRRLVLMIDTNTQALDSDPKPSKADPESSILDDRQTALAAAVAASKKPRSKTATSRSFG